MVEKIFQNSSEPSLQSQESNKSNGVQFRLRITKNQHKQIKPPKLPFQQTEPNEPAGINGRGGGLSIAKIMAEIMAQID